MPDRDRVRWLDSPTLQAALAEAFLPEGYAADLDDEFDDHESED